MSLSLRSYSCCAFQYGAYATECIVANLSYTSPGIAGAGAGFCSWLNLRRINFYCLCQSWLFERNWALVGVYLGPKTFGKNIFFLGGRVSFFAVKDFSVVPVIPVFWNLYRYYRFFLFFLNNSFFVRILGSIFFFLQEFWVRNFFCAEIWA